LLGIPIKQQATEPRKATKKKKLQDFSSGTKEKTRTTL
jgi:hypothetical protein